MAGLGTVHKLGSGALPSLMGERGALLFLWLACFMGAVGGPQRGHSWALWLPVRISP